MTESKASKQTTQQVIACVAGDKTELQTREIPRPGDGEMLLAMRAVGLCGTDLFKLRTNAVSRGLVLGHELVGEVCALGANVDRFAIGDRVAVAHHVPCGLCEQCRRGSDTLCTRFRENLLIPGAFAEYVLVRERAVDGAAHKIPPWMSDDTAVWMEPAACVMRGVWRAQIAHPKAANGLVVVLGAGSMGLLHLLVLKAECPQIRVLVVDPLGTRREFAASLGADDCVAPGESGQAVHKLSDGLGADAVFDTVGGAHTLKAALQLTREGGSVILFAHAAQHETADFDLNSLFKYERRVLGSYSGGPAEQARVFELMCGRELDPAVLVSHRLPLSQFADGVRLALTREAIKVVFVSTGDEP